MSIQAGSSSDTDCDRPGEDTLALEQGPPRNEHE